MCRLRALGFTTALARLPGEAKASLPLTLQASGWDFGRHNWSSYLLSSCLTGCHTGLAVELHNPHNLDVMAALLVNANSS